MFHDTQARTRSFAEEARDYADRARAEFQKGAARRRETDRSRTREESRRFEAMLTENNVKTIDRVQAKAILSYAIRKRIRFGHESDGPMLKLKQAEVDELERKGHVTLTDDVAAALMGHGLPYEVLILSAFGEEAFFDAGMVYVGEEGEERVADWHGRPVEDVLKELELPLHEAVVRRSEARTALNELHLPANGPIRRAVSDFVQEAIPAADGDLAMAAEELADGIHFGLVDAVGKITRGRSDEIKTYLVALHKALVDRLSKNGPRE